VGFEPTNGGFADQSWISILLVRLAFTPAYTDDFSPYWGLIVPRLFPTFGVVQLPPSSKLCAFRCEVRTLGPLTGRVRA
jgi:hypothetical protein